MTPAEYRNYVPDPRIVLYGCTPLVPHDPAPCPACKGLPIADATVCGRCHRMSDAAEARCLAARVGLRGRDDQAAADQAARAELLKRSRGGLTEGERRRLWNGYRGGLKASHPEPCNRAKAGRDWLTEKGWEPDWSLVLDGRGNVVGRTEEVA